MTSLSGDMYMTKNKIKDIQNKVFSYLIAIALVLSSLSVLAPSSAKAKTIDCNDPRLSLNDIQFWNPCEAECPDVSVGGASGFTAEMGRNERLRYAVKQYGEHAMAMQKKFGTPWEIVFAQMVMESGVGTAGIAVNGATNNWLGIKGTGDAGTTGRDAKYSSIEASITDWAGTRVLRNGLYDAAFKYTDPNNYDIRQFFASMIEVYAPTSDGNNTTEYKGVVYSLLDGDIKSVREEMNWPSSAELAKKENIPIGGEMPLGQSANQETTSSSDSSSSSTECTSETIGMDLEGMVYFDQCDPRWAKEPYGSGSMCSCACGPTSMSMIIATLNNDKTISPPAIAKEYYEMGGQIGPGNCGSNWMWEPLFSRYNLKTTDIGLDLDKAREGISAGGLVIFSWAGQPFTSGGHIMVMRGFNAKGEVLIASSGGQRNLEQSKQAWPRDLFENSGGLKGMWVISK